MLPLRCINYARSFNLRLNITKSGTITLLLTGNDLEYTLSINKHSICRMQAHLSQLIRYFFISVLLSLSSYTLAATDKITAYKIITPDNNLARKIAISYHHAVLEIDYEDGYIIADLSEKEITQLRNIGLEIQLAKNWNDRYKQFRQNVNSQRSLNQGKNKLAGIPGFECYPTVEETLQQGSTLSLDYPQLSEWIDIGDSWKKANNNDGFDLMVLKITNQQVEADKPKLFIHSSMHAREYTPAALTLDFATHLLENYSSNIDIQWIVDYHEIHILFHMNPDGRKIAETGISQRKNLNSNHCASEPTPGTVGVDLNRNFAFYWNSALNGSSAIECEQTFRGISPESEPETQAVSNYIRSLFADARGPDLDDAAPSDTAGMHLDIHSYSELVLWPYGHVENASANDQGFVALGNKLAWFNDYTPQQSIGLYPTDGTSDDVSYGELGIAAFTFELGTSFFEDCSIYQNTIKPDNLDALIYAAKVTAKPYLLAFGPEVTEIKMNGSNNTVTIGSGSPITLTVTANALRTKQSTLGRTISKVEYSIDIPIWQQAAELIEVTQNDGDLSSGIEEFSGDIDSSNLSAGKHTLYVRAYNESGSYGVPTAATINIAENNSPQPDFSINCNNLACQFDASNSSDEDGTISSFSWDFNGEETGEGEISAYTFSEQGDKQVILTIVDNSNNQAIDIKSFNVQSAPIVPEPEVTTSSGGGSMPFGFLCFMIVYLSIHRRRELQINKNWPNKD